MKKLSLLFIGLLIGGICMAEETFKVGNGRFHIMTQKEIAQMKIEEQQDILALPEIGESNPSSDWIYLGYLQHPDCASNIASYNWKNKETGKVVFAISPKAPDVLLKIEVPGNIFGGPGFGFFLKGNSSQ